MSTELYLITLGVLLMVIFGPKKLNLYSALLFILLLFVYFSPISKNAGQASISYDSSGNIISREGDTQRIIPKNGAVRPNQN